MPPDPSAQATTGLASSDQNLTFSHSGNTSVPGCLSQASILRHPARLMNRLLGCIRACSSHDSAPSDDWRQAELDLVRVVEFASRSNIEIFHPESLLRKHGHTTQISQPDEQWEVVYRAAREFFSSPLREDTSSNQRGPAFRELVQMMVERAEVALNRDQVPGFDAYQPDLYYLVATACSTLPDSISPSRSTTTYTFLVSLNQYWVEEQTFRWTSPWSPMPWSRASRAEQSNTEAVDYGVPSPFSTSLDQVRGLLKGDFIYFPPMHWYGGTHDGYPQVCLTLGEYTRLRRTPRFSRFEDASLWQSVMTFGLLEALMEIKIPETLLLRGPSNNRSFASGNISLLVFDWLSRFVSLRQSDPSHAENWIDRMFGVLSRAANALAEDCLAAQNTLQRGGLPQPDVDHTLCAIGTLVEALSDCALVSGIVAESPFGTFTKSFLTDTYLLDLVEAGWCPFVIHALVPRTLSLLAYAITIPPPPIREREGEHEECTPEMCVFYQVDENKYTNRHTSADCTCPHLIPPVTSVLHRLGLDEPEIPVVSFDGNQMAIHGASDGPYVAISHVWADGLGSTTEKGLPACQVARVAALARRLVPSGAFWMDSLCVPEDKPLRKRAIILMAETYRRADVVLVIDAGISACLPSMPAMEKLLRIKTSGWMQRLWTLQEGMLARKLVFQVADDLVEASSLTRALTVIDDGSDLSRSPGVAITPPYARGILESMAFLTHPATEHTTHSLGSVIGYLEGRATSKAEDETIAISGLVDVSPRDILAHRSVGERMKTFLLLVRNVPRGLPFASAQKLEFEGFRWAPRTLARIGKLESERDELATCTPAGLEGEYTLICFSEESITLEWDHNGMLFRVKDDANNSVYVMVLDLDPPPTPLRFNAVMLHGDALPTLAGASGNCAAIFLPSLEEAKKRREDPSASSSLQAQPRLLNSDPSASLKCGMQLKKCLLLT
ncbi:hypothetical protein C8Q78DRAFT_453053 [Trametes maxima]|nr:hypothetical protein C8Q78DRAFT_453053 [Trametes maxima]